MHSFKFIQFLVYTLNLIECLLFEFVSSSRMSSPSILLFDEHFEFESQHSAVNNYRVKININKINNITLVENNICVTK